LHGNGNGKNEIEKPMDNPPRFFATIPSSYVVLMAADKQVQAIQEATVLQSRDYTRAGMNASIL
jgi:hypothetical protein